MYAGPTYMRSNPQETDVYCWLNLSAKTKKRPMPGDVSQNCNRSNIWDVCSAGVQRQVLWLFTQIRSCVFPSPPAPGAASCWRCKGQQLHRTLPISLWESGSWGWPARSSYLLTIAIPWPDELVSDCHWWTHEQDAVTSIVRFAWKKCLFQRKIRMVLNQYPSWPAQGLLFKEGISSILGIMSTDTITDETLIHLPSVLTCTIFMLFTETSASVMVRVRCEARGSCHSDITWLVQFWCQKCWCGPPMLPHQNLLLGY